jgi:hypothetical protein
MWACSIPSVTGTWELISSERKGQVGRRAVVAKTFRMPVREVPLAGLVTLAMAGRMTDPGGVLLALPYLMGDPGVRAMFAHQPR